ncbi:MAG: hypothetical protein ABIG69_06965 [Bacteroidota bacterium]
MRIANLAIAVIFDETKTSAEEVADVLDNVLHTALLTDGILDIISNPEVGEINVDEDYEADVSG